MNKNYIKFIIKLIILVKIVISENDDNNNDIFTINSNENPREWAVYLYNKEENRYLTEEEVNKLAEKKDFINLGKIGELEGYWLFKMKEEEEDDDDENYRNDENDNEIITSYIKKNENSNCKDDRKNCINKKSVSKFLNLKNKNNSHEGNKLENKKRNGEKKYKRTIYEAEEDLDSLNNLHWFEKQKYVQRYKREFIGYNVHDIMNNGIKQNNVYEDNIEKRSEYINSLKYNYEMSENSFNKKSFINSLNEKISFTNKIRDFGDDKSNIVYDFDSLNFTDPFFFRQWHLYNNGTVSQNIGNDINVVPLWKRGINGTGVVVSVIDDGVEWTHEDINPNWNFESSYDFSKNSKYTDKTRLSKSDSHGTRCAGAIAAQPNSVCGVGVAFGAKIAGERLISSMTTDSMEATALNYKFQINDIYSNSWGPNDDGETLEGPGTLCGKALENGVIKGRKGYGSIFIFASGNGGIFDDNCNCDGFANSIYTIAVGAIAHDNKKPFYAEVCSAQLAVTYSGDRKLAITTIDIMNSDVDKNTKIKGCTSQHSGTSAAAPIASGIIALMLSARPDLGWRDVQHIIVDNAIVVNPEDSGWSKNGAGRFVHHAFGFGKMDAEKLVNASISHKLIPVSALKFSKMVSPKLTIPIDNQLLESTLELTEEEVGSIQSLEHVQISVKLPHKNRRFLTIKLISPSGTESLLATERPKDESSDGYNPWTFMTVFNWGESPVGTWKLVINDSRKTENPDNIKWKLGRLVSWKITVHGLCNSKYIKYNEENRPYCDIQLANNNIEFNLMDSENIFMIILVGCIVVCLFLFILFSNYKCDGNAKYEPLQTFDSNYEMNNFRLKEYSINNYNNGSNIQKSNNTTSSKNKLVKSISNNNINDVNNNIIIENNMEKERNPKNIALMRLNAGNKGGMVKSWSLSNLQERKANLYNNNEDNSPIVDDKKFNFPKINLGGSSLKNSIEGNTRENQKSYPQSSLYKEFGSTPSLLNEESNKKPKLMRSYSSKVLLNDDDYDNNENKYNKKSNLKMNKSKSSYNLKF